MKLAQMDVLRAVAQRLFDRHIKAACGQRIDAPVETNAAAGVQFDFQQADRRAVAQLRRVIGGRQAVADKICGADQAFRYE